VLVADRDGPLNALLFLAMYVALSAAGVSQRGVRAMGCAMPLVCLTEGNIKILIADQDLSKSKVNRCAAK
jgi:hypothetical protein